MEMEPTKRIYRVSTEEKEENKRTIARPVAGLVIYLHFVLIKYQMLLERINAMVVKHPGKIILIVVLLSALSCLGFLTMSPANLNEHFFLSDDSRLAKDFSMAETYFPSISSRREEVIISPAATSDDNVFSSNCLKDALLVHETVVTMVNFSLVCMGGKKKRLVQNFSCMMTNPLEACDFKESYENCLHAIARAQRNSSATFSDGRTFKFNQRLFTTGFKPDNDIVEGGNISARAIRFIYYLKSPSENDPAKSVIFSWEASFLKKMKELRSKMNCASIYFTSSQNPVADAALLFSLHWQSVLLTFAVLMFVFVVMVSCTMRNCRPVTILFGFIILSPVAMGLASSLSISYLASIKIWNSIWIVMILMFCKGATDAFILIDEMDKQRHLPSVGHRIANCITKSGMSLTTSNLISILCFGFALTSSFPVVREFALTVLIHYLYHYFFFLVLFMALLFLFLRKFEGISPPPDANTDVDIDIEKHNTTDNILVRSYGRVISSRVGSVITFLMFLGILACSSYMAIGTNHIFDSPLMVSPTTEAARFLSKERELFGNENRAKIVFNGKLNFSDPDTRQQLQSFTETLSNGTYSQRKVESWINYFEEWVKQQGLSCIGPQFSSCLVNFLKDPGSSFLREDMNFTLKNDTLNFLASYIHLYMIPYKELPSTKRILQSLRRDISSFEDKQKTNVGIVSRRLDEKEQLIKLQGECIWFASVTGIAISILCLIFTANPRIAVVLVVGYIGQVLELVALLELWEIPLNYASIICLALGFIISVNLSTHMSQIRSLSVDNDVKKRTVGALSSVGTAIFFGGILAILGSIGLGFAFPNLSLIFFRVLPIHFALGVFHSLAYIPSVVLITSKPMEACAQAIAPSFPHFQEELELGENKTPNYELPCSERPLKLRLPSVAISGISCRFPNAENKELFWDMLTTGKSGFQQDYPQNRPSENSEYHMLFNPRRFTPGRLCALGGAYLHNIRGFDAEFFNISPQEAKAMDPQQRILLQTAYEAIEDAGLRLEDLQKGNTGVFVGAMNLDYGSRVMQPENRTNLNQFYSTGITASILANRISFCLNLTGPSLTVDTACSSSLVAVKIAMECLRSGECDVALVCAPNIILDPSVQIVFSVGGLLAPDGRCKSFDASGDGYGRGEGFAAVILKLTKDAIMDRDDMYCEILSCGMNNDGQNAVPITAPSTKTQAELSQRVLEQSGLHAHDVEYLEAHGTGTAIGDVVEMKSVAKTYCGGASGNIRILSVGSVKSNLNHTESASGLAGLIKVALMLKKRKLVPTVNIKTLNPKLNLAEKGIKVQDVCEPWIKDDGNPRTAAINSFGYGGSNVHAILQEHRENLDEGCIIQKENSRTNHVLTLTAHSEFALHAMATRNAKWMKDNADYERVKEDICWSLNTRRSQFPYRLAVVFESLQGAAASLELFAENKKGWEHHLAQGKVTSQPLRAAFVFGGQGSNWSGMGKQIFEKEPHFRLTVRKISNMTQDLGETWSLENELFQHGNDLSLQGNIIGQTATFAIQYATAKLLESWGIVPVAVIGHSLGELTASCVAGVLTLEEALRVVLVRSRCHEYCPMDGCMAALGMSEEDATQLIIHLKLEQSINIAAINDGNSVTLTGDKDSIECVQNHLQLNDAKVFWKKLSTARAFHSFQMEMVKDYFQSQMKSLHLRPMEAAIPLYSTVTGDIVSGKTMDENYWWCNFRQPVQFCKAMQNILRDNYNVLIEISSQPSLGHYIRNVSEQESQSSKSTNAVYLPTHPRKFVEDQHKAFLHNTVCRLYTMGYSIDWEGVEGVESRNARFVRPPPYPWQTKDYWYLQDVQTDLNPHRHAFLSNVRPTECFEGLQCWDVEVDLYHFPTFRDHALMKVGPVLPGSAYIEMAIAMTAERFCCDEIEIKNVQFNNVLTIPENQVRLLRLQLQDGKDGSNAEFQVKSIPGDGSEIVLARGEVSATLGEGKMRQSARTGSINCVETKMETDSFADITARMKPVELKDFRLLTEKYGFDFGPSFSHIKMIWKGDEEALCIIVIEKEEVKNEMDRYILHPAFLDACFQTSAAVEVEDSEDVETKPTTFPVRIHRMEFRDRNIPEKAFCYVSKHTHGNWVTYDINLMDSQGNVLLEVEGFQCTELSAIFRSQKLDNVAYEMKWVESAMDSIQLKPNMEPIPRIVLQDSQGVGQSFCDELKKKNPRVRVITVHAPLTNDHWEETLKNEIGSAILSVANLNKKVQLVNFLPIDADLLSKSYDAIDTSQMLSFVSSIQILKAVTIGHIESAHLLIVTRNSQLFENDEIDCFPWASSVMGLRRTASLEFPNIRCTTIDLSSDSNDVVLLTQEVEAVTHEDEIAFRRGKRFANRVTWMEKSSNHAITSYRFSTIPSICFARLPKTKGVCFMRNTWPRLSKEHIKVNLACTWVVDGNNSNFSDSRIAGFSGRVCEVLAEKTGFHVGDKVCGVASFSSVGNYVQVHANHVIHKPEGMSDPQSANLPLCLAAASYIIRNNLEEGKKLLLLVDDTNIGPGRVTTFLAKALGHEAIDHRLMSTLGSKTSVNGVRQIDAAIFFQKPNSKCLLKTCQLLKEGGKLVICEEDVKGSITIPAAKKITCVRISFIEFLTRSKSFAEIWHPTHHLMQSADLMNEVLRIPQTTVNVFQLVEEDKSDSSEMLQDYSKMAAESFVSLSFGESRDFREDAMEIFMPALDRRGLKADRTYMVVGGMRGFGFEVAKWMAEFGAKTIVLVARSEPSESKLSEVSELKELTGANIVLHQADASSSVSMKALEDRLATLPSVAGIVHSAMVLRDELIPNLTTTSFREVLAPKVKGAFLLHEMSLKMDLDFFVLFSSIASLLGNPGQASYAAANAFLDGLSQYRRFVLGLPAVSINWGPIKGAGVLQREGAIAEHLSRAGYFLLPSSQAIEYMEKILIEEPGRAQLGLFDVDWQKIQSSTPGLATSTRLIEIRNKQDIADSVQFKQLLVQRILVEKNPNKREEMVHEYVTDLLCSWTGNSPSDLDFNSSLYNYGMDSFSGLTFKMQIESSLHISFEVFYFTQPDTTPARLVKDINQRLNDTKASGRKEEDLHSDDIALKLEPALPGNVAQRTHTAKDLIHPIDDASPTATYHLIPLCKPEQAEVKLFCVHPAGRYVMNLTPISNGFTQQSLVAFYGIGYTEPTMRAEDRSVRKMAQSYVRMIKEVQRHGPYYLAGQSFGGLVAYEIANVFTEQNEDVAFVAMIDTFPWYMQNRTGAARLELLFSGRRLENLLDGLFEATFEQVLSKLATTNLTMTAQEYKNLRERETLESTIAFLQNRAADHNIPIYDITSLRDSVHHDNMMATRKHKEWKPPQVRFKGPLTYFKSADQKYTPTRPLQESSDAAWSLIMEGNIDVYICPGDHLALSEPEDGAVVGQILAAAVGLKYRTLRPTLPRVSTTFKERRSIHKFEDGVDVLLYSKKAFKTPRVGTLFLDSQNQTLSFKSTNRRSDDRNRTSKPKKIPLKELRNIVPGNHEPSFLKIATKMHESSEGRNATDFMLTTSIKTGKNTYNLKWHDFRDMREFYSMIEAVMCVTVFKK